MKQSRYETVINKNNQHPDGSVGGNIRLIPDGPSGDDVGAGCLHNLPHFTDGYFTGARLLDGG